MKGAIFIARKYKKVKEKNIAFDMDEREIVERRAEICHMNTTAFIRQMAVRERQTAVREPALFYDAKELAPMLNRMRIISSNINQAAKKQTKLTASQLPTLKSFGRRWSAYAVCQARLCSQHR